jgi:uncharacterized protein (TIGR02145 family)
MVLYRIAERVAVVAAVALLLPVAPALAQRALPFTVLTSNADLLNHKLYVEIMYEKPSCSDYQAKFRLEDKSGLKLSVAVDSVLNNAGTYALSADGMSLMRPQAGGYKLRFSLPKGAKASDSIRLCIESHRLAYRCVGCGPGKSDAIFEPDNFNKDCPYKGSDMLACHRRRGAAGNWEGWIQDSRDCKPYRVALMPDGRWWFAQNLAYTKMVENSGNANIGKNSASPSNDNSLWGNYWCVGIPSRGTANATATSGQAACDTYGALYTWNTVMRRNGASPTPDAAQPSTWFSQVQGICPDGWLLPSDFDWGMMLNSVEGCQENSMLQAGGGAPCNHLLTSGTSGKELGARAFSYLKSTLSCPPHLSTVDSSCATAGNGAWIWHRSDKSSKLITPRSLGEDVFGFSMLPSGRRHGSGGSSYFTGTGMYAGFWTSSEYNGGNGYYRYWDATSDNTGSYAAYEGKFHGKSVRCLKNSAGDGKPHILRLQDISGVNTQTATFIAYTTFGATVDWYDAPENGRLLRANSPTYSTNMPIRVYARARDMESGNLSPMSTATATFTYSYSGSSYTILLNPGVYTLTCYGAKGANSTAQGGYGGMVEGDYVTSAKVTAYVFVGGMGQRFNGAGSGGSVGSGIKSGAASGATGGGASDVRVKGADLGNRIIVAGGGGGGGGRGSDTETAGAGGEQEANGKVGGKVHSSNVTSSAWPQGGGGGGGGGFRNGAGGTGGNKYGSGGCRPGLGGATGGAGTGVGNGGAGGASSYYGCSGGGGGGGTHYVGGVKNGVAKNAVNAGDGRVIIKPQ